MPHEERSSEAALLGRRPRLRRRAPSGAQNALHLAPPAGREAGASWLPLHDVQRWLQAVIVHPGEVGEALASDEAAGLLRPESLGELVKPSHSLTAAERLEIYHGMYLLRMIEALETDYPALRHLLGEEDFGELVRDYVQAYPSRSYTLNRLGDHLPRFLAESAGRPNAELLHEIGLAELAITEVFDEEESPVLTAEQVRAIPAERWPQARVVPIAALRVLSFDYPVLRWLDAARRGAPAPAPVRKASRVVVYRQRYSVLRLELSRAEFTLLAALAAGRPLGEAVAAAGVSVRERRREGEIFKAFRSWVAEGMFSSLEL